MKTTENDEQILNALKDKYHSIEAPKELYRDILRAAELQHTQRSPKWQLPLAASLAVLIAGFIGFQFGKNAETPEAVLVKNYPGIPTSASLPKPPTMAYVSLPPPPGEIHPSIWKASGFSTPNTSTDSRNTATTRIN